MRTFGIEEEFFVVEPLTGPPCVPPASARSELLALSVGGTGTRSEFIACQFEGVGPIRTQGSEALESAQMYRKALAHAVRDWGYHAVALGTPPRISTAPAVLSSGDRYRAIHSLGAGLATAHYLSGLHVHVQVDDLDSGIVALN